MSQTANASPMLSRVADPASGGSPAATRHIVFALYEGVTLLDVAGPAEAFNQAVREVHACDREPPYRLHYVVAGPRNWVVSSAGLPIRGDSVGDLPETLHTLLVPGASEAELATALGDSEFLALLDALRSRTQRLTSVCTGAFFLGELGLLDGRRATTHWAGVSALAERYPNARVAQDQLFERDGNLWTSAGVLSGVDMALAMIEADLGRDTAIAVARRLVVFLVRHGGQSQFSAPINLQGKAGSARVRQLVAWLQSRLMEAVTVSDMAQALAVSERTLHRRCKQAFALTPAQLLSELRLEHARGLLLSAESSVKEVARASGFATSSAFTKAFTERFGVAPTRYRENFVGH